MMNDEAMHRQFDFWIGHSFTLPIMRAATEAVYREVAPSNGNMARPR